MSEMGGVALEMAFMFFFLFLVLGLFCLVMLFYVVPKFWDWYFGHK